jgi:hypothetical protein
MVITQESIIYSGGNQFGPSLTFPVVFLICLEENLHKTLQILEAQLRSYFR